MKITDFSGGLNIRVDPILIAINEAVKIENVDNTSKLLVSTKLPKYLNTAMGSWFYKFKGVFYSSDTPREYLEYRENLLWTEENGYMQKIYNKEQKKVGLVGPPVGTKLTAVENGAGDIYPKATTVSYVYTYYDSSEAVESIPSEISDELALPADTQVLVTGFVAPIETNIDLIRLYRRVPEAQQVELTLIAELPITTIEYEDNIEPVNAIGYILDSLSNYPPRFNLRNLIESNGYIYGTLGNKVYYNDGRRADYWPPENSFTFSKTPIGLQETQDGIVVMLPNSCVLFTGSEPSAFSKQPYNTKQGCKNFNSCEMLSEIPVWISNDGICSLSGGNISVITRDKLGKINLDVKNTVVYDDVYYVCLNDGYLFALDLRFTPNIRTFKFQDKPISNIGVFDDILYAVIEGELTELFEGLEAPFHYISPEFTEEEAANIKQYDNIYIRAKGDLELRILIDGVEVSSYKLKGDKVFEENVPQEKQTGSSIQFDISGVGTVKEIEYKVLGRLNGR